MVAVVTGNGLCGCQDPRRHEDECLWRLGPQRRVLVAAATVVDPFRAPQVDPDAECVLLARIHLDVDFARRVSAWISGRVAA